MNQATANKLTEEEICELMKALGFHQIPSRKRWKMKVVDKVVITDTQLRHANESDELREVLTKLLFTQILQKRNLSVARKINMLTLADLFKGPTYP